MTFSFIISFYLYFLHENNEKKKTSKTDLWKSKLPPSIFQTVITFIFVLSVFIQFSFFSPSSLLFFWFKINMIFVILYWLIAINVLFFSMAGKSTGMPKGKLGSAHQQRFFVWNPNSLNLKSYSHIWNFWNLFYQIFHTLNSINQDILIRDDKLSYM